MRHNPNIVFDTAAKPTAWNFKDHTGERFGRLTTLRYAGRKHGRSYWHFRCDCGVEFAAYIGNVKRGFTTSCGCLHSEIVSANAETHGETRHLSRSPEYACWAQIKTRCTNPNYSEFHYYGGRGISVCQRWLNSFEAFLEDMGRKPSSKHSIDRIDPDGNYEPGNCRWATAREQRANQRRVAL